MALSSLGGTPSEANRAVMVGGLRKEADWLLVRFDQVQGSGYAFDRVEGLALALLSFARLPSTTALTVFLPSE